MFKRAIVIDVITHPNRLTDQIISLLLNDENNTGYALQRKKNKNFLKKLPRNSIIATFIQSKERFIAIPFFSSHMSLPLKKNEEVWIFEDETISNRNDDIEFFWLSRIHGLNFYEDANYSHPDRKFFTKNNLENKIININEVDNIIAPVFNNGPVREKSYETAGSIIDNIDKNKINSLNISGEFLLEDIPRYTKNPGDFIIQGSNNTLIKLGTSSSILKSDDDLQRQYNSSSSFQRVEPYSGTIDLVAGRAAISQSLSIDKKNINYIKDGKPIFSKSVTTKAYKNSYLSGYNELGLTENIKDPTHYLGSNLENPAEGDSDFFTDISRVMISEYSNGDELLNYPPIFHINEFGEQEESFKNRKRGYIIAKSDEVRLVARNKVINRSRSNQNKLESNGTIEGFGGSIKLIKEGNENFSYINMEENGAIAIDGPMIVIGDQKRAQDNGLGNNIFLGNNAIEPAVLGFQLKERLEHFMDQVVLGFNKIGEALKQLNEHAHPYAGPAGITQPPQPGVAGTLTYVNLEIKDYTTEKGTNTSVEGESPSLTIEEATDLGKIIANINTIKTDLNKILSTMVKTN